MGRVDELSMDELQRLRTETKGEMPRERVLAAIGRKQGDTIDQLAERHGVVEKTIRNWLDRFEKLPLQDAPYDGERSGRPSKLSAEKREALFEELRESPTQVGYDRETWTSTLVADHIEATYDVEYTSRHSRELLKRAECFPRTDPYDPPEALLDARRSNETADR